MQTWHYILISVIAAVAIIALVLILKNKKNVSNNTNTSKQSLVNIEKFEDGLISDKLLKLVGGSSNIDNLTYCKTRIKLQLIDSNKVNFNNDDYVNSGVAGIIKKGSNKLDIIIGFEVEEVAKQIESKLS